MENESIEVVAVRAPMSVAKLFFTIYIAVTLALFTAGIAAMLYIENEVKALIERDPITPVHERS